jgi:Fur family ferric uptake transcriptional regulator
MGLRAVYSTRPRERIAALLKSQPRFMTAADVHRALHALRERVSLSTVYRTLEHLLASGAVTVRVDESGEASYLHCDEPSHHHHHAICRACGSVQDVDCSAMDRVAESLRAQHGFLLDSHKMEFSGLCRDCQ